MARHINRRSGAGLCPAVVTKPLRFVTNEVAHVVSVIKPADMKKSTPFRIRIRRFITNRYAYRDKSDNFPEFLAIAIIVLIATWPIVAVAQAMATAFLR